MEKISTRYIIKIPKNISLYYSEIYQSVLLAGPLKKIVLKLKTKIILSKNTNMLKITREPFLTTSKNKKNRLKINQGTLTAILRQLIVDLSINFVKKLKLIGIGFKCFILNISKKSLLQLKLGYSHNIFFKIPDNVKIYCLKTNSKIYISGNFYSYISQLSATIRSLKFPEPYKGKGILYNEEQIIIKEGKKL
jgi:large subunit ribosomal protein L6